VKLSKEIASLLPDDRMAQWSLRWILDHPEVTTVIPGATKISQVKNNIETSDLPALSNDTHQKLRALYDSEIKSKIRGHF
jgi:aryl-alcohol dehydrogenase-like predicted oxidoreductase